MELKNAVAICLISLFSATLVVLIARALDSQAATRLEPHLAQIVEELRAIRTQGGISAAANTEATTVEIADGLMVYYFHGNIRCPTCEAIESQTHDIVQDDFAAQLGSGTIAWKVLNYEEPASVNLTKKFDIHMANVVLARMDGGEMTNWKRLDQVWALVGDKPAFADFMRSEIEQMLQSNTTPVETTEEPATAEIPVPAMPAPPVPDNEASADLPLPE
jgi:hypothetical protein